MAVTTKEIKELRELTGAGMLDCKKALEEAGGDIEKAVVILRERGLAKAVSKASRHAGEGRVEAYIHPPGRLGALVEVRCETDFVALTDEFKQLAKDLAMQVAAASPKWVSREQVPEEVIESEKNIYKNKAEAEGRPAQAVPRIVEGQLENFFKENCLLEQPYFRDPKRQIKDVIAEYSAKLGEKVEVTRFARFNVKEG
jgi:elongation factor Ts